MSQATIRAGALNAGYANSHVLSGMDFKARQKGITVITGPSGNGKSTLPKSVLGLSTIYSGDISFHQKNITGLAPHCIA